MQFQALEFETIGSAGRGEGFGKSAHVGTRFVEVDRHLSVQPEIRRGLEAGAELERHLARHRRAAIHDPVDDLHVAAEMVRELLLAHPQRLEEFLVQDLARRGGLANHLSGRAHKGLSFTHGSR